MRDRSHKHGAVPDGNAGTIIRNDNRSRAMFNSTPMTLANDAAVHTENLTKVYKDFWGRDKVCAL